MAVDRSLARLGSLARYIARRDPNLASLLLPLALEWSAHESIPVEDLIEAMGAGDSLAQAIQSEPGAGCCADPGARK